MPVPLDKESEAKVREQAIIYNKETKRPLSAYQKQINEFAGDIAARNPSLLTKRGELLQTARAAVYDSGYAYKKGHSRSKRLSSASSLPETPNRPKLNQEIREQRIHDLTEEISDLDKRISFKEKRVNAAASVKKLQFKACDEITDEIAECKAKCRQLLAELKEFKNKDKRSKAYRKSTGRNVSSNECHHPKSPLSSDDERGRKRKLMRSPNPTHSASESEISIIERSSTSPYPPSS